MWNKKELECHCKSAKLLMKIKDMAFDYIKKNKNISEYDVQQFILEKFKEYGLKTDKYPPIVAFGKNTSQIHYFPNKKSKKLKQNDLILVDLWANFKFTKSPFADTTWMAYNGKKVPKRVQEIWNLVRNIRDEIILFLKRSLKKKIIPTGKELNQITKDIMNKHGFSKQPHYTGHCLGFTSAHGNKAAISPSNKKPLEKNLAYTIEPGIYLKNQFGIRSEIDFYIDKKFKLHLTTSVQKEIKKIVRM